MIKKINSKKNSIKSTHETLIESMTPQELKEHEQEYQNLVLSELLIAITNQNEMSVRKLAKEAGVSPTVIQSMRSGEDKDYSLTVFFKVLKGLGFKQIKALRNGKTFNIPIPTISKKD